MARGAKTLAAILLATVVVPLLVCAPLLAETVPAACHLNHHHHSSQPMNHACCTVNRPSSFLPSVISHGQDVLLVVMASAPAWFVAPIHNSMDDAEKFPDSSPPLITSLRI